MNENECLYYKKLANMPNKEYNKLLDINTWGGITNWNIVYLEIDLYYKRQRKTK